MDNLTTPEAVQVQLKVRFAEINKSAIKQFRAQFATLNPQHLDDNGDWVGSTNTGGGGRVPGRRRRRRACSTPTPASRRLIQFLQSKGDLQSLAEPNLITLPEQGSHLPRGR